MRTYFYMLYCADKHKMAYCVFIAVVCVLCFCFLRLFAASLIQLTWDKKKQTTITKIHRIQDMHVHHAATLWAWYHHTASSVCILSLSIDCCSPFFCCEDNSTKPHTQIHTHCRQAKGRAGHCRTGNISPQTASAEPCAHNHRRASRAYKAVVIRVYGFGRIDLLCAVLR